jgi:hypothetical protein
MHEDCRRLGSIGGRNDRIGFRIAISYANSGLSKVANRRNYSYRCKSELRFELALLPPLLTHRPGISAAIAGLTERIRASLAPSRGFARSPVGKRSVTNVRLSTADQWSALSNVLTRAVVGAGEAGRLQKAATQQLDLAQYGISTLVDELSAVMTLTGRRDRLATLYVLGAGTNSAASLGGHSGSGRALAA